MIDSECVAQFREVERDGRGGGNYEIHNRGGCVTFPFNLYKQCIAWIYPELYDIPCCFAWMRTKLTPFSHSQIWTVD